MMEKVLIVDDELGTRESLRMILKYDYELITAQSGKEALQILSEDSPSVILLDIMMPGEDGLDVLEKIKQITVASVIMITALKDVRSAVRAMKIGAFDYITKPFNVDEIKNVISKALSTQDLIEGVNCLRSEIDKSYAFGNIISKSKSMRKVFRLIEQTADKMSTVLISGESGTGKELVAKAVHYNGPRKDKPFVAINCAAIPDTLLESELFGYEKGAFTNACERRIGRFELADQGTLFLDEIAELSLNTQVKILRFLQEREISRIGGSNTIKVDTRLIGATNKNLENALAEGKLREDFYYRINIIPIIIPPLRERKEDIPLLVDHFIHKVNEREERHIKGISQEALSMLISYHWPGNVRELENIVERTVTLTDQEIITDKHLPPHIKNGGKTGLIKNGILNGKMTFPEAGEQFEKSIILDALEKTNYVQTRAAAVLGISRRILKYKMDKFGIQPKST
ncbi:MAG: sigma-54-dependent Fis family transcriptional regulator [Deltaproteobacteria bacterium]|nr:sigma-54-dependent Fis family transcriptional regulator [Deltaproteobacteria bacterium]